MNFHLNRLKRCVRALLVLSALLAAANVACAFNQDHYFLYKTVGGNTHLTGIAVGSGDRVYVTEGYQWNDGSNNRLSIYDPDLNLLSRVSGITPFDVAVADDGTVYVADYNGKAVRKYDASGNSLGVLCSGYYYQSLSINPSDQSIYVRFSTDGNVGTRFSVYKPDGAKVTDFSAESNRFAVARDGRLYFTSANIYNTNGIRTGMANLSPSNVYDIRFSRGRFFTAGWSYDPAAYLHNSGFAIYGQSFQAIVTYWPTTSMGANISYGNLTLACVNQKGDIIGADGSGGGTLLSMFRRCEANSMGPEERNAAPTAEVTSITQRANTTLIDIDYRVTDLDNPTVEVAAAAFKTGSNSIDNMILLNSLAESTGTNVGPAITTGTTHHLTWDARADWGVDFGDVQVHIFARDNRPLLMGLHFLSLPASGTTPAMTITRCPVNQSTFIEPLMWLAASKSPLVSFTSSQIKGVGGSFDGQLLASGTTVTLAGRQLVEAQMGVREATADEIKSAKEAACPGNVNQWDLTDKWMQEIDQTYPLKVNEYGFDTGAYDTTKWFWLIKVN